MRPRTVANQFVDPTLLLHDEVVGDRAAVAAPGDRFGAHHGGLRAAGGCERLADAFVSRLPIKILQLPIAVPTFDICIHWHERYHHDPGSRWMRRAFVDLFASERRHKPT